MNGRKTSSGNHAAQAPACQPSMPKTAARKPDAAADTKDAKPAASADAKTAAKPAAKPAASRQAAVKPDAAAPAEKQSKRPDVLIQ